MTELKAVRAGRLVDVVAGEILTNRSVIIGGDRVDAVVAAGSEPDGVEIVDLSGATVLPGLIDCHAHMIGELESGHGYAGLVQSSAAHEAMTGVRNAAATLTAGFTTVRDVGTFRAFVDCELRDAIAAGWTPGPRMQCAGAFITSPGGGGDVTGLAADIEAPRDLRFGVSSNVDEVRDSVRRILHGGAELIKVIATGAVLTEGTVPGAPEFTEEEIRAAVQEAAPYGVCVAAHAHGAEGIKRAVRAGVRSIEHGSLMDEESIELMASAGTYLVADIFNGDWIEVQGTQDGWSEDVMRKSRETTQAQREGFTTCVKAGVNLAYGTDSGVYPHEMAGRQFAYMVRFGMTPMEAIQSATIVAARMMGWEDRVGSLQPGRFADLIAVEADPIEDVSALEDVSFVMKGGDVYKG